MTFDNTNRGVLFAPKDEASDLVGVGNISFGSDKKNVLVLQGVTKEGKKIYKVYAEIGVLFDNNQKTNDKAPDKSGPIAFNGTEYSAAGWRNRDKNDNLYTTLKLTPKDADWQRPPAGQTDPLSDDDGRIEGVPF